MTESEKVQMAADIKAALAPQERLPIPVHPSTTPEWKTMLNPQRESALRVYTEEAQACAAAILSRPGAMTPEEQAFILQGIKDHHAETGGRW